MVQDTSLQHGHGATVADFDRRGHSGGLCSARSNHDGREDHADSRYVERAAILIATR